MTTQTPTTLSPEEEPVTPDAERRLLAESERVRTYPDAYVDIGIDPSGRPVAQLRSGRADSPSPFQLDALTAMIQYAQRLEYVLEHNPTMTTKEACRAALSAWYQELKRQKEEQYGS